MSDNDQDQWISTEAAVALLGRTRRQLDRYVAEKKIRKRPYGRLVKYHRGDIERLRETFPPESKPKTEITEIIPAGELLQRIDRLQGEIMHAAAREGYLRAQLEQRPQLEDQQRLERELRDEQATRRELERQLQGVQKSRRAISITALIIGAILVLVIGALIMYIVLV